MSFHYAKVTCLSKQTVINIGFDHNNHLFLTTSSDATRPETNNYRQKGLQDGFPLCICSDFSLNPFSFTTKRHDLILYDSSPVFLLQKVRLLIKGEASHLFCPLTDQVPKLESVGSCRWPRCTVVSGSPGGLRPGGCATLREHRRAGQ